MKKNDIVYILKDVVGPDELRYSIRSVVENFPYKRIIFYGGKPEGITPDKYVALDQVGYDRYEKVIYTIDKICRDDDITDDFWLFNDDFFIMNKVKDLPYMVRGTMANRIQDLTTKYGANGGYVKAHTSTQNYLIRKRYDTLDYAMHVPMLINRKQALDVLNAHPNIKLFRTLYGNVLRVGGLVVDDCKIYDTLTKPNPSATFLSTTDRSFHRGEVGKYIRKTFQVACPYEGEES